MSEPTRQFTIELPERLARRLEEEVAAGSFPDIASGVRESVEAFLHDDDQLTIDQQMLRWIRDEVMPISDAVRRGDMRTYSAEEVFGGMRARVAERLKG